MIKLKQTRTKVALFEAACLLFANGDNPSIAEISSKADISRATFHRHFSTREDFLNAMAEWALSSLEKTASNAAHSAKTFEDAFWFMVSALIPMGDRYHFLIRESHTLQKPKIQKRLQKQNKEMHSLISHLQSIGVFNPELTPVWINTVTDALIYSAWEQVQAGDLAPNAAGPLVQRTLLNGTGISKAAK